MYSTVLQSTPPWSNVRTAYFIVTCMFVKLQNYHWHEQQHILNTLQLRLRMQVSHLRVKFLVGRRHKETLFNRVRYGSTNSDGRIHVCSFGACRFVCTQKSEILYLSMHCNLRVLFLFFERWFFLTSRTFVFQL